MTVKSGVVAGFLGSLCCTGPLLLITLGLGSAGLAAGVAKFRPFFITLAIVFIVFALYRQIKKKHGTCSVHAIRKELKTILIAIITAVVIWALLLYVIVPFIARLYG